MSKANKRYFWLKLKEDFFEDDTIEWLEEQDNGSMYALFYLKLCLKSLKTEGVLVRKVGSMLIPYDVKKLAEMTKTPEDTVRVAMELFKKLGIVQILEDGEIYLPQLQNMVGSETEKAQLMRNKRAKEKAEKLAGGNNVTPVLPNCYTEKEQELQQEKYKELASREKEKVDFIKDLFIDYGWSDVTDAEMYHIYSLVRENLPLSGWTDIEIDIKVYDVLRNLLLAAQSENAIYIYRWLMIVIPDRVEIYC